MLVLFDVEKRRGNGANQWKNFLDYVYASTGGIETSIGDIASLATAEIDDTLVLKPDGAGGVEWGTGFAGLTDGNGTTANGSAVDLGGTLENTLLANSSGSGTFRINIGNIQNNATNYRYFYMNGGNNVIQTYSNVGNGNSVNHLIGGTYNFEVDVYNFGATVGSYISLDPDLFRINLFDLVNDNDVQIKADNVYIKTTKVGATQVAAGAGVGDIWLTSGHATLPDGVMMKGI